MKKIEKEITVTRFEAFDGTEFETEQECLNYEGSAFGKKIQELEGCTLGHYIADDGRKCWFLVPHTRHDIFVLGQILKMAGNDDSCADIYGHLTLLSVSLDCNTVATATVENLEDFIRELSNGQYEVVSSVKPSEKTKK